MLLVAAADAPRLSEIDVVGLSDAKLTPDEHTVYKPGRPLYVFYCQCWEITYHADKQDSKKFHSIKFTVDDTTGFVRRHVRPPPRKSSNHTMQTTAGQRTASLLMTNKLSFQTSLATTSGG
jgi:hypothetical protein